MILNRLDLIFPNFLAIVDGAEEEDSGAAMFPASAILESLL